MGRYSRGPGRKVLPLILRKRALAVSVFCALFIGGAGIGAYKLRRPWWGIGRSTTTAALPSGTRTLSWPSSAPRRAPRCLFRKFDRALPDNWREEVSAKLRHGNEYHVVRADGSLLLVLSEHLLESIEQPTESRQSSDRTMSMKARATGEYWSGEARIDFADGGTPGNVFLRFSAINRAELDKATDFFMTAPRVVDKTLMPGCEP